MEKKFTMSNAIHRGWETTKENWIVFVGFTLAIGVISGLLSIPSSFGGNGAIALIFSILSLIIQSFYYAGITKLAIEVTKGNECGYSKFKEGLKYGFKMLSASLIFAFILIVGLCVFIIPGILLGIRFSMAFYVIVDQPEKGVIGAFKESWKLTKNNGTNIFVLVLYSLGITILGFLCFFVGVFFTSVISSLTFAAAYNMLKEDYICDENISSENIACAQ